MVRAVSGSDSSLVLYRESLPSDGALDRCPRKLEYLMLNRETGAVANARCKANGCPYCGPVNALLVGGAILLGQPERVFTLTAMGRDWQTVRARFNRIMYDLRGECGASEVAYNVEPNPSGTGEHHVHGWQRGAFWPQRALSRICDRRGAGRVTWIEKCKQTVGAAVYGVKLAGVAGYGLKLAEAEATMGAYLGANGGRLVHASRGYWLDENGCQVGQREAMTAWARSRDSSDGGGRWEMVRQSDLSRAVTACA